MSIALSTGTILGAVSAPLTGGGGALLASGSVTADTVQSTARAVYITSTAIKKGLVEPEQIVRWVYHKFPINDLNIDFAGRVADKVGGRDANRVEEAAEKQQAHHKIVTDGGFPDDLAAALTPLVRSTDATPEQLRRIELNLDAFDSFNDAQKKRALAKQLIEETDEPVDAARQFDKLDADTLRYASGRGDVSAAKALLDRGVPPSRIDDLAVEGVDLTRHQEHLAIALSEKGSRTIKGPDDIAEILANNKIRHTYSAGHEVKAEVVLKSSDGEVLNEIDTVVLDESGQVVAMGETKSTRSLNAYQDAVEQIEDGTKIIEQGGKTIDDEFKSIDRIETAGGDDIPLENVNAETLQNTITSGPIDAVEGSYDYRFIESETGLEELSKTFDLIGA